MKSADAEPELVSVRHEAGVLTIVYSWPRSVAWPNVVIGLMLLAAGAFSGFFQHFLVPAVVVALAGLGVLYNGLKLWLNKTTILATADCLRVSTGPIPFGRPRVFSSEGLVEFFVATPVRRERSLVEPTPTIFLTNGDSETHRLTDAVPSKEVAAEIRHRLLRFYGLKDLDG